MSAYETELEAYSNEAESESEQESFFNHLAAAADRAGRPQSLRRVAIAAAREAFKGANRLYPVIEGEGELEFESENEFELEATATPVRPGAALALMEHMAHEAVNAESESEAAEQFLPLIPLAAKALLPLAAKALPLVAKALPAIGKIGAKVGGKLLTKVAPNVLKKVAPNLTRGVSQLTRGLFRNRATRPLLRAVPTIARRTVNNITRQVAAGRRVTPQTAARTLARQTRRTLGNPRAVQTAYRRGRRADAAYHQRARRFTGRRAPSRRTGMTMAGGGGGGGVPGFAGGGGPVAAGVAGPAAVAGGAVATAGGGCPTCGRPVTPCQCMQVIPCANCGR